MITSLTGMKRKKATAHAPTVDEQLDLARRHAERNELADAEAFYRRVLERVPEHLGALTLLGLLLIDREDVDAAIDLLERARDIAPDFPPVQLALGSAYGVAGHDSLAVVAMETASKLDTTSTLPLERLAKHHIAARRPREAIGLLRRILRRDPAHAHARFLLGGLTGTRNDEGPPPELIADLFDTYATRFDQHLVDELQYDVPRSLAALIADLGVAAGDSLHVVDLGCGTGLAGVELRAFAKTLVGSDLSPRMIARARQRGIYDDLHVEDLVTTLGRVRGIDLILAADVFIYVGMLEPTFAACRTALRPGGLLAFSVERSATVDVVLQPTLRYAHADAYIRRLAETHDFTVARAKPSTVRIDNGQPVDGVLYVLRGGPAS
jgi:predicted TPR repeat methyltransferase